MAVELEALCAGCENSDRARSPVSNAISRFLKLFIVKEYLSRALVTLKRGVGLGL